MGKQKFLDKWGNRLGGVLTLWSLVPPSLVGFLMAYFAAGVAWISALGAFGVFASGLIGFCLTAFGLAQIAKWRLQRIEAKARARWMGDSTPFDPMDSVYRDKRFYIRDLAPAGRRVVHGKKFINCEIIGPANIVLAVRSSDMKPWPDIRNNIFSEDCDFIQVDPSRIPRNAVAFLDCDFDGCMFWSLSLLFRERENESWNWITRPQSEPMLELPAP